MKLAELQAAFQAAVLAADAEDAAIIGILAPPNHAEKEICLGVYVNAYRLRLAEFLMEDYSGVCALIGDDNFEALVEDYIDAMPSHYRNARYYSTSLPDFMAQAESWRNDKAAIDMARFERALLDAFDAADAEVLKIEALADYAPEQWPRLAFTLHPSLRLLELEAGTVERYLAVTSEEECASPEPRDGSEAVAVWRMDNESSFREVEADEFLALNEALAGHAFSDICQMVAFHQGDAMPPDRLAQLLATWFAENLVVAVRDDEDDRHASSTPSSA